MTTVWQSELKVDRVKFEIVCSGSGNKNIVFFNWTAFLFYVLKL